MTPVDITLIITGIENLVAYLLQLKKNGQLTDAQLDTAVATSNTATRALIAQFLADQPAVATTPPAATQAPASAAKPFGS